MRDWKDSGEGGGEGGGVKVKKRKSTGDLCGKRN